jgi:carbon-monoxide dehydrogenase medium subunit
MSQTVYDAPVTVDVALQRLAAWREAATIVAGGQDVVPLMNQGRLVPSHLLDISRLPLTRVEPSPAAAGAIRVGALVTHAALSRDPTIRTAAPLLAEAAAQIGGGPQVRNRGTIGGAAAAANPAYDLPACLVALDAVCVLCAAGAERRLPAASFFLGAGRTARRPDELLLGFDLVPSAPRTGWAYIKLTFTAGGPTIAGAACVLTLAEDGRCARAAIVLSGVAATPCAVPVAAARLVGRPLTADAGGDIAEEVARAVADPLDDAFADGVYRRAMAGVVAAEAVQRAAGRARAGEAR